jgi:hypothetical protein
VLNSKFEFMEGDATNMAPLRGWRLAVDGMVLDFGEKKTDSTVEHLNLFAGFFCVKHCFTFGKIL